MKIKILTFNIILLFLCFSSNAQKFEFGIKGGGNIASQKLNNVTNIESITGFHLGGFLYFKLPILFGIQAEAHYSQQGSKFSINQIINTNSLDYINIPILIRNDIGPLNVHFGPQFGILKNARNDIINNIKDQLKGRDFSLVAGVGLRLPARLGISLRYVKGLKNISDPNLLNSETKNSMFQFSIKYSIVQLGIRDNKK